MNSNVRIQQYRKQNSEDPAKYDIHVKVIFEFSTRDGSVTVKYAVRNAEVMDIAVWNALTYGKPGTYDMGTGKGFGSIVIDAENNVSFVNTTESESRTVKANLTVKSSDILGKLKREVLTAHKNGWLK